MDRSVKAVVKPKMDMKTFQWMLQPLLILVGVVLIIIGFLTVFDILPTDEPSTSVSLQKQLEETPYTQTVAFPIQSIPRNQQYLVNFSPITGYLAGYIGPEKGGVFNPTMYLTTAFKAGIRSFVLPISTYNDNNKTPESGWPYSGNPAVVCRDESGTIISTNGMSVRQFVEAILQNRGVHSYYEQEPIYLFLEEVTNYVPDKVKDENNYVSFMNKIAADLSALDSTNLRILRFDDFGELGSLIGGERERELLTMIPVEHFYNKIIISTNFNTRLVHKSAYKNHPKTLHEYVNFIYKPMSDTNTTNNASKNISMNDIRGSQINWLAASQATLYIAENPSPLSIPDASSVSRALSQGIQIIPIPFLFNKLTDTKEVFALWKATSALVKPVGNAQDNLFTKPEPIVPSQPNEKMNARVSPQHQPGQLVIS